MPSRFLAVLLALTLGLAAGAPPAAAATASLVADLNPNSEGFFNSDPPPLFPLGGKVLFSDDGGIWASDGTSVGTTLLRNTAPQGAGGIPRTPFVAVGRIAFFVAEEQLWRTDGTPAGTFPVGPAPSEDPGSILPPEAAVIGATLFFRACGPQDCGLWKSDGTPAGTVLVEDIGSGEALRLPYELTAVGNTLFFLARTAEGNPTLWRSNGTAAGTVPVHDFFFPGPRLLTAAGGRLFFVSETFEEGQELWTSDGTAAGTRPLTAFAAPEVLAPTTFFEVFGDSVYFVANDVTGGADLWTSDGTPAGTRRVTDFGFAQPFGFPFGPGQIDKVGDRLLFIATDGLTGLRLWTSDGTPGGTAPLAGCPGVPAGRRADRDLRPGQPCALRRVRPGERPRAVGERRHRRRHPPAARHLSRPLRLRTHGGHPPARPRLFLHLARLRAGLGPLAHGRHPRRHPPGPARHRGVLRFQRARARPLGPQALLPAPRHSGRPAALGERRHGPGNPSAAEPRDQRDQLLRQIPEGGRHAGRHHPFLQEELNRQRLWATDGTPAGARPLTGADDSVFGPPVVWRGKLLFALVSDEDPLSFWESDGTPAGTRPLFELPQVIHSGAAYLTPLGAQFYFVANDSTFSGANNLWVSDGTAAGTRRLTSFEFQGFSHDVSPELTRVGGTVFFVTDQVNRELWRTDGTVAGTRAVAPSPGPGSGRVFGLREHGGAVLFFAATAGGFEDLGLWRSDGTPAGTVLLAPVAPPSNFFRPPAVPYAALGSNLFFPAGDGVHGVELWRTDGTAAGTVLVRDIEPGALSSNSRSLLVASGRLFFVAGDGAHGRELWQSDGTAAGTRLVQDIAPGGLSSDPQELTISGDRLFFRADDGLRGAELWVLPLAPGQPACQPSPAALCLQGNRFRAEAFWRDFQGNSGVGQAVPLTADTGYFWFFDTANVEVVLKVLDGRGLNEHFWAFYGALSSVEYTLTVTDTTTGAARRYANPPGRFGSVGDTSAFGPRGANAAGLSLGPAAQTADARVSAGPRAATAGPCVAGATRLCLNGGRFAVEARWRDFQGNTGAGRAVSLTADTGYFWFFDDDNVEVVLKVIDGRPLNGKFWVFYGALSSVEYTLTVTDTLTGASREYTNPSGRFASMGDTGAF